MVPQKNIKVKLVSSPIGQTQRQRQTLKGLGLTRVGRTAVVTANPSTIGMLKKVAHLVRTET